MGEKQLDGADVAEVARGVQRRAARRVQPHLHARAVALLVEQQAHHVQWVEGEGEGEPRARRAHPRRHMIDVDGPESERRLECGAIAHDEEVACDRVEPRAVGAPQQRPHLLGIIVDEVRECASLAEEARVFPWQGA